MKRTLTTATMFTALLALAWPAAAQDTSNGTGPADTTTAVAPDSAGSSSTAAAVPDLKAWEKGRPIVMQYYRPLDSRGVNMFETTKFPGAPYTDFKFDIGAAFASEMQNLSHSNTAVPVMVNGVNTNQLANIGFGLNNPTANLYLNAQLAPGIRVAMTSYLSSRHHNETWVKDGYVQVDESPIDWAPLNRLMQNVTLRVGDMEINYGDAHFRRGDNGEAVYNPFIGNYIMDAFTTQIGAEAYLKSRGLIGMVALTGGELRGTVLTPDQRSLSVINKLGFDRQLNRDLRVRLTGSLYKTDKAMSDTLYGGDRAGSPYFWVLENTQASETTNAFSGTINPGFRNKVTALQMNPFVKYRGLEVFGVLERADGRATAEVTNRTFNQYAVDTVYRFFEAEKIFVGARYNRVNGNLTGIVNDVGANRWEFGAGWFVIPGLLVKAEYVDQKYFGFPVDNIKNGGHFKGTMLAGVVAF
jgi:hypothetical protein